MPSTRRSATSKARCHSATCQSGVTHSPFGFGGSREPEPNVAYSTLCAGYRRTMNVWVKKWRILMPKYLGALTIVVLLGMVLTRISVLRRQGIKAMKFGNMDKTDFLIPPFALFYFYVLFAAAFHWPAVTTHQFFHSEIISWIGVLLCLAGLLLFLWSLISFRQSFRVGIDADHPDRLITDGVFAFSRNPIYVAFAIILIGEFFIFPNWISLIYLVAPHGCSTVKSCAKKNIWAGITAKPT